METRGRAKTARNFLGTSASLANALPASGSGHELDKVLAAAINTANTTPYDAAIDSSYLASGTGGSQLHHLVDGQHDVMGALAAAGRVFPADSLAAEIFGTAHHLAKDLFSVMGLPVISLNPGLYQQSSEWIAQHLGISRAWQADLLQINGLELLGGGLAAAAVVLGARHADAKHLMDVAGGTGLGGMLAANPVALLAAAVALVMAWQLHRKGGSWSPLLRRSAASAGGAAVAIATGNLLAGFAAMGAWPLFLSLVISLTAGIVVRKLLLDDRLGKFIKEKLPSSSDYRRWIGSARNTMERICAGTAIQGRRLLERALA